jgi:nitrite reductase/ring-hydroxylating ferredoxin subunit/uncharacterized membrane protein
MKSTAHIKSHPLHPILIVFPIAFLTGTLLFDLLAVICDYDGFWITGRYLNMAGVISGLIAAIPGCIDLLFTVPPDSSAMKRGVQHALINVLVISIFAVLLFCRKAEPAAWIPMVEFLAVGLMTLAGWMGGTLVHRNQIGVDIRYAGAGKWKEQRFPRDEKTIRAASSTELELNQMKLLHVGTKRIVLGRTESGYVAFDDRCTHRGGSLAGGSMICGTVQCPWHGSQFSVTDGSVKAGPAGEKIAAYKVREEGGEVWVEV